MRSHQAALVREPRAPRGAAWPRSRVHRGQVLIEFALISLVLYLLLAVTLEFGRATYSAQVLQQAADVAARELSLIPLPADESFDGALESGDVKQRIYDEQYLVVDLSQIPAGTTVPEYFANKPILNQLLLPIMVFDESDNTLRYPGALLVGNHYRIPIVHRVNGEETIEPTDRWPLVVEEIRPDLANPNTGPFSVTSQGTQRGVVALRINFPFQSAALTSFNYKRSDGQFVPDIPVGEEGLINQPIDAPAFEPGEKGDPYAGTDRLGKQAALINSVRPFRRVISAQAIYRREVFQ